MAIAIDILRKLHLVSHENQALEHYSNEVKKSQRLLRRTMKQRLRSD